MVDLDSDAHQYRLDEIKELEADIDRLKQNCYEQYKRIEALEKMLDVTGKINFELSELASDRMIRIEELEAAQGRLKEALRVNIIRYADAYVSHEDIDALIEAALVGNKQ